MVSISTRREGVALGPQSQGYSARPSDRHRLVERLLRSIGRPRPLVVWLDDIHFGLDALNFTRHVLAPYADAADSALEPCPILFVLTVSDEALAERLRAAGAAP